VITTHAVMNLLVGAMALLTAETLTGALTPTSTIVLQGATVAYAEQSGSSVAPGRSSTISAPALSTVPVPDTAPPSPPSSEGVLDGLAASIGRTGEPGTTSWHGMAGADVNRRSEPNRSKPSLGILRAGTPVEVVRWVTGEEIEPANDTWAQLSDGSYVFSTSLRRDPLTTPPALPADAPTTGRWIDVNLT